MANRQSVTAIYGAVILDKNAEDVEFSKNGNDGEEVSEIKSIPINNIDYNWALNHGEILKEIFQ